MRALLGVVVSSVLVSCGRVENAAPAEASPVSSAASPVTAAPPPAPPSSAPLAPSAPSAPPRVPGPAADPALCKTICALSEPLKCKAPIDCAGHCRDMAEFSVCTVEMRAALECFAGVPPSGWECDESGAPAVKDSHCVAEQARVAKCLQDQQK